MKKRINLVLKIFKSKNYKHLTFIEIVKQVYNILKYNSYFLIEEKIDNNNKNEKVYYIIRRTPPGSGFFSNFHLVLSHMEYAYQKNYQPIIDYKNYSNYIYGKKNNRDFRNYWDDFFNQPTEERLVTIKKQFPYILSQENILSKTDCIVDNTESLEFLNNSELIDKYSTLFKNNIYFKNEVLQYFESIYDNIFSEKLNILGASIRGTDYVNKKYPNHYKQPSLEEFIKKIDSLKYEWKFEHIFLSTEDEKYRTELKQYYGNKLFYLDRQIYNNSSTPFKDSKKDFESYLLYVCEIYLLSRCDFILGAPNGGFSAAIIFNANKFKEKYIFNLGKYS